MKAVEGGAEGKSTKDRKSPNYVQLDFEEAGGAATGEQKPSGGRGRGNYVKIDHSKQAPRAPPPPPPPAPPFVTPQIAVQQPTIQSRRMLRHMYCKTYTVMRNSSVNTHVVLYIQADSTVRNSELERFVLLYNIFAAPPIPKKGIIKNRIAPEQNKMRRQRVKWQTHTGIYTAVTSQFNFVILLFFGVYSCRVCVCMYKVYIHRLGQCNVSGLDVYAV